MDPTQGLTPDELQRRRAAGSDPLLVCAYEEPHAFRRNRLEGALSLQELRAQLPSLDRSRWIVFY